MRTGRLSWPEGAGQAGREPSGKVGGRAERTVETRGPGKRQTGTKKTAAPELDRPKVGQGQTKGTTQ